MRLDLSATARQIVAAFRRGAESRNRVTDDGVRFLGQELGAQALPGGLGEALAQVLDLAAFFGRLVTFEVRTADPAALALPWELLSVPRHPLPVREGLLEIVRRIPGPGDSGDPAQDTAASIPAASLSVLGFTAAPLEDEDVVARLGAGGFADSELFWEREQERLLVALEDLLREGRGRLSLPDTGEKEDLRLRLGQSDRPQIVHISCHGGAETGEDGNGEPVLLLEDEEGRRAPLQAAELLSWIRAAPGEAPELELLVLAACNTAGAVGEADPAPGHRASAAETEAPQTREAGGYAERLVRNGLLRVLGMQSTVSNHGATAFAEKFYTRLADGADLSLAMRAGRAELGARGLAHEWAVPTLTTRCAAGPLVVPEGNASPVESPFEAVRGAFDIEGISYLDEGYVGRREAERRLRRAFEEERLMAIHGLGGIGKSTLAARFLERRQADGWRVLILYAGRELASSTVLEEVAAKLGLARPVGVPADQAEAQLQEALKQALRAGPAVLFLDNFEDNQAGDGSLKNAALGEALLGLARLGGERFRLLFTSRHRVHLGPGPLKVRSLDLGGLSPSGCRKLRALPRFRELGRLPEETWQRALFHFGGHPKALELLEGFLREQPERARELLSDMGPAVAAVDEDLQAKQQVKGRRLLVDSVLAAVPPERRPAFDRLCLLEVPLPTEELESLLAAEGVANPVGDLGWLRDHGFLARTVAPSALTGGDAVHRLLASHQQESLAQGEGPDAGRVWHLRVAEHLIQPGRPLSNYGLSAWHRDAAGDRAGALDMYRRWANALRSANAYSACVQIARQGLSLFSPGENKDARTQAAFLNARIHEALWDLGERSEADEALASGLALLQGTTSTEAEADLRTLSGRALVQRGKSQEAEGEFQIALDRLSEKDFSRERTIVLGEIAGLRSQAGDVAGALKLNEERLQIFEQLGDIRERALTLGDIARLRAKAGDVAGALKLHEEKLQIFEQLGDVRERALTLGDIARLRAPAGDGAGALTLHEEILQIFEQLGDVQSRAVTLGDIARLRAPAGDGAGALKLHEEELKTYEQLGDVRSRAVTLGDIARLRAQGGDIAGALKLQEERLRVNRQLGDIEGIAAAQYDLAGLDLEQGNGSQALERLGESWNLFRRISRADFIASCGQAYGTLLAATDPSRARDILRTSREAFQMLGMTVYVHELDDLIGKLEQPEQPPEG